MFPALRQFLTSPRSPSASRPHLVGPGFVTAKAHREGLSLLRSPSRSRLRTRRVALSGVRLTFCTRLLLTGLLIPMALGASNATPEQKLDLLRQQGMAVIAMNGGQRPTQLVCTVSRSNVAMCEAVLQARTPGGAVDPGFAERRLETYLLPLNAWGCGVNPRGPTLARELRFAWVINPLTRDTATGTAQPHLRVTLSTTSGTLEVNSLAETVTGSAPLAYGTASRELVCPDPTAGLRDLDERIHLAIKSSLRGIFRRNGSSCDVNWSSVVRAGASYRIELRPEAPCVDIAVPGVLLIDLEEVNQSGVPLHGRVLDGAGSSLDPAIVAEVCFADRKGIGQTHTIGDYQCFVPGQPSPLILDLCRLTGGVACPGYLFADGFETGDTTEWSTTQ